MMLSRKNLRTYLVPVAVCVLLTSDVVMAQKVAPATNPNPVNGATNVSTTPTLTWTASAEARRFDVRFGTQNPPPIVARNLSVATYQPGTLQPGTRYYWQVDSRGKANDVTPGAVWSFTTVAPPPPPTAPSAPSPPSGAIAVATSTALTWAPSDNTTSYDVAFGTSSSPSIVSTNQTTTMYTPSSLAHATTYYWQVTAKGAGGSTAGPVWAFTTEAAPQPPPPPPPAPTAPSAPSPTSGATAVPTSTTLTWAPSDNTTSYDVAFGTSSSPSIVSTSQTTTMYTPSALAHATTYYWQVTARGAGGSTAGPVWAFTTEAAPQPPPSPPSIERLRVMTWNIRMGQNLAGTMNVDAQVAVMADSGAHIIALQEVTVTTAADLRVQYETKLETMTGRDWTAVWAPGPRVSTATPEGNLLLTWLPVQSSSIFQYDSAPSDPAWHDTKRAVAQMTVTVNGVPLNVFGTHLPLDANHRRLHIDAMLEWINTFTAPRLFAGDFNMVAGSTEHTKMANAFTDVWPLLAGADEGFTMDKRNSAGGVPGRIDYFWQERANTQARSSEIWVIKTTRSDHHALVIDVDVRW